MAKAQEHAAVQMPLAGLLSWILPGLGHLYLGHRARGLILLITICATFWTGIFIGGSAATVNPHSRKAWFIAQLGTGGNTLAAYALTASTLRRLTPAPAEDSPFLGHWLSADVGVHYTGIAGLLNLLVILDAMARADGSGSRESGRAQEVKGGK